MAVHHANRVFPDVEERLIAALHHRRVLRRRRQLGVHVVLHVRVRNHGEAVGPAERRHVEPLLDAGELRDVGLHDVHRLLVDVVAEVVERVDRLAHGNRHVERLRQLGMGPHVEGVHRLLEPGDVELLEPAAPDDRRLQIPDGVDVDHQLDGVADRLPHRLHPLEILPRVGPAELHLHGVEAAIDDPLHVGDQFLGAPGQPAAVGVVGLHFRLAGAEVPPERLLFQLELDVPEGEVHRRQADAGHAHPADEVGGRVHRLHERVPLERRLADDSRCVALVDHHLGRFKSLGVVPIEAVAGDARIGVNPHLQKLDGIDARLRVGDRPLPQRHVDEHGLYPDDRRRAAQRCGQRGHMTQSPAMRKPCIARSRPPSRDNRNKHAFGYTVLTVFPQREPQHSACQSLGQHPYCPDTSADARLTRHEQKRCLAPNKNGAWHQNWVI